MNSLLLVAALAMAPVSPPSDAAPAPAPGEACPAPVITVPRYPANELVKNIGGVAVVLAHVDACGRVVSPRIVSTSGHAALDEAALQTVVAWVLNAEQRAIAKGGVIKLPVKFSGLQGYPQQVHSIPWPESHRSPTYLIDDSPLEFDSIAAFADDKSFGTKGLFKSPYDGRGSGMKGRVSTNFFHDPKKPEIFWLTYWRATSPTSLAAGASRRGSKVLAVARYRLVMEEGEPVVRVALLCEAGPDACARLSDFLLKGLPIAPPPRR